MRYSDTQKTQEVLFIAHTLSEIVEQLIGGRCLLGGSLARAMKIEQWNDFNDVDLFVTDLEDLEKAVMILTKSGWKSMDGASEYYADFVVLKKEYSGVQYQVILSIDSLDTIVERTYTSLSWFFYKLEGVLQNGVIVTGGDEQTHCRTALANELIQSGITMIDYGLTQRPGGLQEKHNRVAYLLGYKTYGI